MDLVVSKKISIPNITNVGKEKIENFIYDIVDEKIEKSNDYRVVYNYIHYCISKTTKKNKDVNDINILEYLNYLQQEKILDVDIETMEMFNWKYSNIINYNGILYYSIVDYINREYSDCLEYIQTSIKESYFKYSKIIKKKFIFRKFMTFKNNFLSKCFGNVDDVVKFKYLRDLGLIDATDDELINSISRSFLIANTEYENIDPKYFIFHESKAIAKFYIPKFTFEKFYIFLNINNSNYISTYYDTYDSLRISINVNNLNKKDLWLFINNDVVDFLKTKYPEIYNSITPKLFKFELEYLYQNISKHSKHLGYWKGVL